METTKVDSQVVAEDCNFTPNHFENSMKDINENNNQNKNVDNENEMKNADDSGVGLEILRKSVSWAEDDNLVEMREIEVHRRRSLSSRILEFICCLTKSEEKNNEDDQS